MEWLVVKKKAETSPNVLAVLIVSVRSVPQSCPTLCDPMDCSTLGFPVHCFPELAQSHVHQGSDDIQPSYPLSSPSPPNLQSFPASGFFPLSALHIRWPKYWSFSFSISPSNEHPGLISFRMDCGSPCSPRDSQESSPITQSKSINSSALSFLYGPTHIHT